MKLLNLAIPTQVQQILSARGGQRLFSAFLFVYFLSLSLHRYDLYSSIGLFPSVNLNFYPPPVWSILSFSSSPEVINIFFGVILISILGTFFAPLKTLCFAVVAYGHACLFARNFLTDNPHIGFLGMLIIYYMFEDFKSGDYYLWGFILVVIFGNHIGGWTKMHSVVWRDGEALLLLGDLPFFYGREFFHTGVVGKLSTWAAMGIQYFSPFFLINDRLLKMWCLINVLMHLMLCFLWEFYLINLAMLFVFLPIFTVKRFSFFESIARISFVSNLLKSSKAHQVKYR